MTSFINWKRRFLGLAEHIAQWSKDPSTKVGAVITTKDNRIISLGFNGFPRHVLDDNRLNDRDLKYKIIIHAEMNAIHFSGYPLTDCVLYTWPMPPCSRCAASIIQVGIDKVIAPYNFGENKRWENDITLAAEMFAEAGIFLDMVHPAELLDGA